MHNVSKTVAGGGHFWLEITMSEGGFQQHVLGLQCHTSGCNVRLEWFVWINGTNVSPVKFSCLSLRGSQWPRLAYIATQVTVISGCSSLLGSMGPRAHTKYLRQAVGVIVHARWVRNGLWRGSFLVKNPHI